MNENKERFLERRRIYIKDYREKHPVAVFSALARCYLKKLPKDARNKLVAEFGYK